MSATLQTSLHQTLRWLTAHAGFPASRLPDKAELLLLIATTAAGEERGSPDPQKGKIGFNQNHNARIRSYTIKRRHAHVKSDNSAKT